MNSFRKPIKILGAGVSGLTAAINLAKAGKDVIVFEKKGYVGKRFNPTLQGLFTSQNIHDFFNKVNLRVNFKFKTIRKTRLIQPGKNEIVLDWHPLRIFFLQRGGSQGSIEEGLYFQARKLQVKFQFNVQKKEEDADIIATGPKEIHGLAYGASYNYGSKMKDDEMLIILASQIGSKGSYMYAIPNGEQIEVIYVGPTQDLQTIKKYHHKCLKFLYGNYKGEPHRIILGGGNFLNPQTAIMNRRLYVGEAAGFQDPFMGFGNHYAIKTGYLAARSIIEGADYDELWKKELSSFIYSGLALRFISSLFGDWFVYRIIRAFHGKITKDISLIGHHATVGSPPLARSLVKLCSRLEILKEKVTGRW